MLGPNGADMLYASDRCSLILCENLYMEDRIQMLGVGSLCGVSGCLSAVETCEFLETAVSTRFRFLFLHDGSGLGGPDVREREALASKAAGMTGSRQFIANCLSRMSVFRLS